jgi:hypothetical protein
MSSPGPASRAPGRRRPCRCVLGRRLGGVQPAQQLDPPHLPGCRPTPSRSRSGVPLVRLVLVVAEPVGELHERVVGLLAGSASVKASPLRFGPHASSAPRAIRCTGTSSLANLTGRGTAGRRWPRSPGPLDEVPRSLPRSPPEANLTSEATGSGKSHPAGRDHLAHRHRVSLLAAEPAWRTAASGCGARAPCGRRRRARGPCTRRGSAARRRPRGGPGRRRATSPATRTTSR